MGKKGGLIGFVRRIFNIALCLICLHLLSIDARAVQHTVKRGETLYKIGKAYSVSVKQLKKANKLRGQLIQPGDVLTIPTKPNNTTSTIKVDDTNQSTRALTTYIVEGGENLYRISLKFNVSISELKKINNLSGSNMKIGQALLVPKVENEEELSDAIEYATGEIDAVEMNGVMGLKEVAVKEEGSLLDNKLSESGEAKTTEIAEEDGGTSIIKVAMDYLGVPYKFGGSSLRGIDCSAYVQRVFRYFSIDLPRTAREQFKAGVKISKRELRIGDLLFFKTYARYPSHVGIYIGEGKMIHASSRSKKVTISSINDPYYVRRYIGAVRLPEESPSPNISIESIPSITAN